MKLGAAFTVTATDAVLTWPPPLATTLMVYLPAGVVRPGARVRVLVPSPGAVKEVTENVPVMPVGKLPTESEMALAKGPV